MAVFGKRRRRGEGREVDDTAAEEEGGGKKGLGAAARLTCQKQEGGEESHTHTQLKQEIYIL